MDDGLFLALVAVVQHHAVVVQAVVIGGVDVPAVAVPDVPAVSEVVVPAVLALVAVLALDSTASYRLP